jgi:hypothetical protein
MWLAIIVVLACVVAVAMGRGGQLSEESPDYAPLDMGPVSATDVVLLRPPTALWGYNMQVTDDALERVATAIRERDVRIVALEQRIADLTGGQRFAPVPASARHARRVDPVIPPAPVPPGNPESVTASEPVTQPASVTEPEPVAEPESVPEPVTEAEPVAEAEPAGEPIAEAGSPEADPGADPTEEPGD